MNKGAMFALGAAFLNALVGVLSLSGFESGLVAPHVAFYKCLVAFLVLSCWACIEKKNRNGIKILTKHLFHLGTLAFFGFFCLYYFETKAYAHNSVALVVFALLASSTIATFVCSYYVSQIPLKPQKMICVLLAFFGLFCLAMGYPFELNTGLLFSSFAGVGYGVFLVLNNRFNLPEQGVPLLWWLSFFGVIYLSVPFFLNGPELAPLSALPNILLLGIGPTIGGFYCTTKALSMLQATEVQLFELAEPMIATILAWLLYHQAITLYEFLGAFFILLAITINVNFSSFKIKRSIIS